jgi:thioredoxin-related protein
MKNHFRRLKFVSSLLVFLPALSMAQQEGIKFETGLSWQDVQKKATAESKLIFIDCYATWCGPCKFMDQEIYSRNEVGNFFNSHFINVKMQMDKLSNDSSTIKDWYTVADQMAKDYTVNSYPTYLFFSSDGKIVHKAVGTSATGEGFIGKAKDALDPSHQYFTLMANWYSHRQDSVYLTYGIMAAIAASEGKSEKVLADQYFECIKDQTNKINLALLERLNISESDIGFQIYLQNVDKINLVEKKKDYVETKVSSIVFKEEVRPLFANKETSFQWRKILGYLENEYPSLNKDLFSARLLEHFQIAIGGELDAMIQGRSIQPKDWKRISKLFKNRFKDYDCGKILSGERTFYYFDAKSWEECGRSAIEFVDRYHGQLKEKTINDIVWNCVFLHCNNRSTLKNAVKKMESVVKADPDDPNDLDTYANLLYKLGKRKGALVWENRAIATAQKTKQSSGDFIGNFQKMQKGEITWIVIPKKS